MDDKFLTPYSPADTEERIYKLWEESGFFNPDVCIERGVTAPDAKPFSIVLPPPNVTGELHAGHAAMLAIEDIMVRHARMNGKKTLWIPGTDHAAIATQSKVEKILLKEENKSRHDLGREAFLERVNRFAEESHSTITDQVKRMGASLDWSREAFTLDEKRGVAVRTAFKNMYEDGLIYQGSRIVNWDAKMQTTVSDDEIVYVEETSKFYYLKYGPFTIATSRPETKFGDKYVVMHPDDTRYSEYAHGQEIELEWINGPITATIIKDEAIDMELGTGVMTITPWHSVIDFEIAERHNLDKEQIIDEYGKLLPIAGEFTGVKIKKARESIVEKLQSKGLVEKIDEKYVHNISTNDRGGGIIEPQIKKQWFINVNKEFVLKESKIEGIESGSTVTLKSLMLHAVESGQTNILPDRYSKVYFHWINNLRDWCISRQIWYGHQIPVWYKEEEVFVGTEAPEGDGWEQDPDTLDTWFSSGLWTFSTLGWPEKTDDLLTYHPTNVLETGYDIIFFWVARMILMSTYHLGEIPFKTVYLHGLVRDDKNKKLSKSDGNGTDPREIIDNYGADALRMALIVGTGPGNDSNVGPSKLKAYKHFANKIWNISRFVFTHTEEFDYSTKPELTETDQGYVKQLEEVVRDASDDIENYRFYLAGEKLYHYVWHEIADKILEESKARLIDTPDSPDKQSIQWTLLHLLEISLKALHPFMPFITEEIWQSFPMSDKKELLMIEKWPYN